MTNDFTPTPSITRYSEKIEGVKENYFWPVRCDVTDGFVRIEQWDEDGNEKDCVLLSSVQFAEIVAFVLRGQK